MTRSRNIRAAALFLAPALIAVIVLRLWPAALALHQSLLAPGESTYSFDNYTYIFSDPVFLNSVWITLLYSVIINPLQIAVSLFLAMILNNKLRFTGFWRSLIFLPVAIPQSVSAVVWGVAFRPDGPLNALLGAVGIGPQRFITSPDQALGSIMLVASWIGVGYWMTMLIAGLQDIPDMLYEAATIDGASFWQKFRHITLPQLRRPLTFVLVADTVANFLVFAPVQILTNGGPEGSTDLIMNEIYTRAFINDDAGSGSAATVVLVVLVLIIVLVQFRMMNEKADR